MSNKRIAYTITDNGMDGMAKTTIMQAFWSEEERDAALKVDKNKAWRGTDEQIVNVSRVFNKTLNGLDGIQLLVLGHTKPY